MDVIYYFPPRTMNASLILPARAGRKRHTFPRSAVWNCQGISRLVGARAKPGVPGARADCPPSQPLAWPCASRLLSSVPIEKSWSCTRTGESTLTVFPHFARATKVAHLTVLRFINASRWYLIVALFFYFILPKARLDKRSFCWINLF